MNRWKKYSREELEGAIKESFCFSDVTRKLGIVVHTNNFNQLKKLIKEFDIDISHFDVKKTFRRNKRENSREDIFIENSMVTRSGLRGFVLKFEVIDYVCAKCRNEGEWMEEELVLQLDHINGVNNDNRIENLRFLCPNCHTQTNTYAGRKVI